MSVTKVKFSLRPLFTPGPLIIRGTLKPPSDIWNLKRWLGLAVAWANSVPINT